MSLPRNASSLRYTSLVGVLCSLYLCLTVTILFFHDKDIVEDYKENLKQVEAFRFSISGIVGTFPIIIFAYMYQVNIPMIYVELEKRDSKQMGKIILYGSAVAVVLYCMIGFFGYATFLAPPVSS